MKDDYLVTSLLSNFLLYLLPQHFELVYNLVSVMGVFNSFVCIVEIFKLCVGRGLILN